VRLVGKLRERTRLLPPKLRVGVCLRSHIKEFTSGVEFHAHVSRAGWQLIQFLTGCGLPPADFNELKISKLMFTLRPNPVALSAHLELFVYPSAKH